MTHFDSEEQMWAAEDPLLPNVRVFALTPENAERDLKLLKGIKEANFFPSRGN